MYDDNDSKTVLKTKNDLMRSDNNENCLPIFHICVVHVKKIGRQIS